MDKGGAGAQAAPAGAGPGGHGRWSWDEIRRGSPIRAVTDLVQYGVAVVLVVLAAIVLVRSFVDFLGSPGNYPLSLVDAVDGVLVVIILIDILRTVLTHLEGWGFPFRPFLVIGIIAAVRDILAVSTRLTLSADKATGAATTESLLELATSAGVVLILAVALFLTRGQSVGAVGEVETGETGAAGPSGSATAGGGAPAPPSTG